jgi:hypothetical protein
MAGSIPKPYVNDVKRDDSVMVYTTFDHTGIGGRRVALPNAASTGPKSLEHVGENASARAPKSKKAP